MHGQQNIKNYTTYSGFNFEQFLPVIPSGLALSNLSLLSNVFRSFHSQGKTGRGCDTKHTDPPNDKVKISCY